METKSELKSLSDIVIGERHGTPIFESNPSLANLPIRRKGREGTVNGSKEMIILDKETGEFMGDGAVAFTETQVVDSEAFVKIYASGIKATHGLTGAGHKMFMMLFLIVQGSKDTDQCAMHHELYEKICGGEIAKRTFQRGIKELLEREIIYLTRWPGIYFYNVRMIFNGDRIYTAKQYLRKGSQAEIDHRQATLSFDESGETDQ